MSGAWWEYLAVFVATSILSSVLTPMALRYAIRANVLDQPGQHKSHKVAVPYLGGLAIVVTFVIAVILMSVLRPPHTGRGELLGVLTIAVLLAAVGLILTTVMGWKIWQLFRGRNKSGPGEA